MIKHAIIKNYKGLHDTEVEFSDGLNIIVGDNECGKSTLLEAINLGLTGQINRRPATYELHPFLFNMGTVTEYITSLQSGATPSPPEILIELYFKDGAPAILSGTNNLKNEDCSGVRIRIELDSKFATEYERVIATPERVSMVPVEYYHVIWESFANEALHLRSMPMKPVLIDPGSIQNSYAANRYVVDIAKDFLTTAQQADLALAYRHIQQAFHDDDNVTAINQHLQDNTGDISEKTLSVGLDMTAKTGWDTSILPHLNDLPLNQTGKGEQNAIKIKLSLKSNEDRDILLLEEPENHLSHTNLNRLIGYISDHIADRQMIVTTHSSFVLNKLGVERTLMFNGSTAHSIGDLPNDTERYFKKLPGHDTLRMVLAAKTILVEGPSDELIVQKAYMQQHGRLPLEDGVEVITVNSLAFKRFLDIAILMNLQVVVVTDNDGSIEKLLEKYNGYFNIDGVKICYTADESLNTLEPCLVDANDLLTLNSILGTSFTDKGALSAYMQNNKTEAALKIFESDTTITIPQYILNAVQ